MGTTSPRLPESTLRADPRWLIGAVPDGLVAVGPEAEIEIELDPRLGGRLLDLLARRARPEDAAELTGSSRAEAARLIESLAEAGALVEGDRRTERPPGTPLAAALLAAGSDGPVVGPVWTAEEALVVPADLAPRDRRRLLHAFVAGIEPGRRRRAYAYAAATGRRTVRGDAPPAPTLAAALAGVEGEDGSIHLLRLRDERPRESLDPADFERLGVDRTHRLGPVTATTRTRLGGGEHAPMIVFARMASPNLAHPGHPEIGSWAIGVAPSAKDAERVARAEAAERFAAGWLGGRELVRAAEAELEGAVRPDRLFALNRRQLAEPEGLARHDPEARYLWTPAKAADGSRRWVLAEAAFVPFRDFEGPPRTLPGISSGVAAHSTPAAATRRALCELVERDAFMWTWVQHVSRERIATRSLPVELRGRAESLAREGAEVDFVNLTLESLPVVLCALRTRGSLILGAGCDPDPARAARKALDEASGGLEAAERRRRLPPIAARDVRTPFDHLLLYRDPELAARAAFLHASADEVALPEIAAPEAPIAALLADRGEVLTIDLGCPQASPFAVVRAIVPGLVPMTFGWDREPLGLAALARPRRARPQRLVGSSLDLAEAGPLIPHPFS